MKTQDMNTTMEPTESANALDTRTCQPIQAVPFVPTDEELASLSLHHPGQALGNGTGTGMGGAALAEEEDDTEYFTFQPPSFFANYKIAEDAILVGDCHITRGDLTVIGGLPGCGKSRLLMSLAIAGQQGKGATWMGLPVHAKFTMAILQSENGEVRLKREVDDIFDQGHELDGSLHITPPPRYGLAFGVPGFREKLRKWLAKVRPGVLAIDPWNKCVPDDKARDYTAILNAVYEVLPEGPDRPAIVIVHHLRKKNNQERRARGRDLLHELSGSYVIGSSCRVAFILEAATPEGTDNRVVFTCAKNNNGELGSSTAWYRRNGLFAPCEEFDWEGWENGEVKRTPVELADLRVVFGAGNRDLRRKDAVDALLKQSGASRSTVYEALKLDGRFKDHLSENRGILTFTL